MWLSRVNWHTQWLEWPGCDAFLDPAQPPTICSTRPSWRFQERRQARMETRMLLLPPPQEANYQFNPRPGPRVPLSHFSKKTSRGRRKEECVVIFQPSICRLLACIYTCTVVCFAALFVLFMITILWILANVAFFFCTTYEKLFSVTFHFFL